MTFGLCMLEPFCIAQDADTDGAAKLADLMKRTGQHLVDLGCDDTVSVLLASGMPFARALEVAPSLEHHDGT